MAIVQNRKSLLDTTLIDEGKVEGQIQTAQKADGSKVKDAKKAKKGIIGSTIEEVKKVNWPSFGYVLKWSVTIVAFTFIFAIVLGVFDHGFKSGIKFIDCSSPQGKNRGLSQCGSELLQDLTLAKTA